LDGEPRAIATIHRTPSGAPTDVFIVPCDSRWLLGRWRILPYTEAAIARVAQLRALHVNVGLMDLRIAAVAMENQAVVVAHNRRDFGRIPGLSIDDWSV
jgi:predicted nucleic acid-binding protein